MTLEHLANIAEIIGILIVVITLIYLAIQTKQNNDLLEAQSRFNLVERRANVSAAALTQFVQESVHKYAAGEAVSAAEKGVAMVVGLRMIELWEWQFNEYCAGMLKLEQLPLAAWRSWYRGTPFLPVPVPEVWESRSDVLNPDFVAFVEKHVVEPCRND